MQRFRNFRIFTSSEETKTIQLLQKGVLDLIK